MVIRRSQPARRGRRQSGPRRKVSWENLAVNHSHGVMASVVFTDLTPEPMQTVHLGVGTATIRRMLGHLTLSVQAADAAASFMSVGVAVVSQDALAAGALPDPEGDFNQDWYYWTRRSILVPALGGLFQLDWDFDIRSMRRLRGGYALVFISESPLNPQITDLEVSMRTLWSQEP